MLVKALIPELVIALIGSYFVLLTLTQFRLLDSIMLKVIALVFVLSWLITSGLRLTLIVSMYRLPNSLRAPKLIYQQAVKKGIRFEKIQFYTPVYWFFISTAISVLVVKFYNEFDVTQSWIFWLLVICTSGLLAAYYKLKLKPYYRRKMNQMQSLLKDLLK
jgi:hypothetical protein